MEDMVTLPRASFWQGKRVLVTGHSGFKGAWLSIWLHRMGAQVIGVGLPPGTDPSLFLLADVEDLCDNHFVDVTVPGDIIGLVRKTRPEIVIHMAAQSLVRASYRDPLETYNTNIMGTANVLEAVRESAGVRVVVCVTTDKVYKNLERSSGYVEEDVLGGVDPYSASKAASELVIDSYRRAFFTGDGIAVASARAGNVIGGGDWAQERLIPDAVRAWGESLPLHIRQPASVRPWQHVLDPLSAYLRLAELLWVDPSLAGAYNFGPDAAGAASVKDVVEIARANFPGARVEYATDKEGPVETATLVLDAQKSRDALDVYTRWELNEAVEKTVFWYAEQISGRNARALCEQDILAYERLA